MTGNKRWSAKRLEEALIALDGYRIARHRICIQEDRPELGRGGFGVVRLALLKDETIEGCDRLVAVKQLRPGGSEDERTIIAVRLARELQLWSTLSHNHILALIGFCFNAELDDAWLVSPYESNGNILEYMAHSKPDSTERLHLVRGEIPRITMPGSGWLAPNDYTQVKDTADALAYLHGRSPPVIHGDLKAVGSVGLGISSPFESRDLIQSNVLVNDDRRAILCDFGLSKALSDVPSGLTTTRALKGSLRYLSPELLSNEKRSIRSDIWAWGCLAFEILTDSIPYQQVKTDYAVILKIASGIKPALLDQHSVPPLVRDIVHDCWHDEPDKRPLVHHCRKTLLHCLGLFDAADDTPVYEEPEQLSSELSGEMLIPDSASTDNMISSENESFNPSVASESPETSAVFVPQLVRPLPNAPRFLRPILRKESKDSKSSDSQSELSLISNDGTASAQQANDPAPDVRPPVFLGVPVRRPLVGVYEWLAIEAALLESEDEDWSDDSDDDTVSKEEIRVRRYRPGVTFDLPGDEEAAMSADESVRHQTPPRSPSVPSLRQSSHQRLRPPSLRPRFTSPYDSDAENSPPPQPLARQPSPLATEPISFVPRASPSPSPPPPPPKPPPSAPPLEAVQEFPLTLPDDLVTQVKNHCRAAAGSVDWQELDAARQYLRAALAILEGSPKRA